MESAQNPALRGLWAAWGLLVLLGSASVADDERERAGERRTAQTEPDDHVSASADEAGILSRRLGDIHLVVPQPNGFSRQVVFLQFGGAAGVTFRGPMDIHNIDVPPFTVAGTALEGQESFIIEQVLANLNAIFDGTGVVFAVDGPPQDSDYSTVLIGGDDLAFREHGRFLAVAEQIYMGNLASEGTAVVFSAMMVPGHATPVTLAEQLANAIAHVIAHLLGYSQVQELSSHDVAPNARPLTPKASLATMALAVCTRYQQIGSNHRDAVSVAPGTCCFIINGIDSEKWTEWYVNGGSQPVDTDHSWWGNRYWDPELCWYFGGGTSQIEVSVYDGDWTWEESHGWTVSANRPPSQPGTISASNIARTSARVSWGASIDPNGDAITYEVNYKKDLVPIWSLVGSTPGTSKPLGGLVEATSYDVRVRACDDQACSAWREARALFSTLIGTRFRGIYVADSTTIGIPVLLEAKLERASNTRDIEGERIYFELQISEDWQRVPDDDISITSLVTDSDGTGSVYYLPQSLDPGRYPVRARYDGSPEYAAATSTPAYLQIDDRASSFYPLPVYSTKTPLVLVHGNRGDRAEYAPYARWDRFLDWIANHEASYRPFDVYVWTHDTCASVGFNGNTGNAADLHHAIYDEPNGLLSHYYPPGTKLVFVAQSRGGLVVRAFMNYNNQGDDVLGLVTLGTPHHGSPFAVPDWNAYIWARKRYSTSCFNWLLNAGGCDSDLAFNVSRLGDLNLAWDNLDGKIRGETVTHLHVDVSSDGVLALTANDANLYGDLHDGTVLYGDIYKDAFGTLAQLNEREAYLDKIVAFAAYDEKLGDNPSVPWYCRSPANQQRMAGATRLRDSSDHDKLATLTVLMGDMSELGAGSAVYYANDGMVPLQSALLLDTTGGTDFSRKEGDEVVLSENVVLRRQVLRQHIFGSETDGVGDHLGLLDTNEPKYWQTITDEIHGFVAGDVRVDPNPNRVDAAWTLTGPDFELTGLGDQLVDDALPGDYTIRWHDMPGWVAPAPNPQTKTLAVRGSLVFEALYGECTEHEGCPDADVGEFDVQALCDGAGVCPPDGCEPVGTSCADCRAGETEDEGFCSSGCVSDDDCTAGQRCWNGECCTPRMCGAGCTAGVILALFSLLALRFSIQCRWRQRRVIER